MNSTTPPLNQILFGPPGTGKTFATINAALEILDPGFLEKHRENRILLKSRFDHFLASGQIYFVTFHQSFSYEDFVEGIRAEVDDQGMLRYRVTDGVFKSMCSTQASKPDPIFPVGERIGAGEAYVVLRASTDLVELQKPSKKLLPYPMSIIRELADAIDAGALTLQDISQKKTFEKLPDSKMEPYFVNGYNNVLPHLVGKYQALKAASESASTRGTDQGSPRVMIIDEINRGNVARIFGDLITLLEPSKRWGAEEALEVTLPYSKTRFSIPANLHLIGTMNTSDRSLAGIDIALRRRFVFKEMAPQANVLGTVTVEGVNIGTLLAAINDRIEVLLGRDYCIGHAYFMPLKNEPTREKLASIFRHQILPLLQEYFFEDWERIHWTLNDHRKAPPHQFIVASPSTVDALFGPGLSKSIVPVAPWRLQPAAFDAIESYAGIVGQA